MLRTTVFKKVKNTCKDQPPKLKRKYMNYFYFRTRQKLPVAPRAPGDNELVVVAFNLKQKAQY